MNNNISADDAQYIDMFNTFFDRGGMSATYKPIFLKALLDLGKYHDDKKIFGANWIDIDGDTVTLDLNFIVTRFIKYCWDLEYSFKLKQTPGSKDASVITAIKTKSPTSIDEKPPSLSAIAGDKYEKLRNTVMSLSIKKQVLRYLLTDMKGLYEHKKHTNKIILKRSLILFLNKHNFIIKNALNHKLTMGLELFNRSTPRIAMKVDYEKYLLRRSSLDLKSKLALDHDQDYCCFYCKGHYTSSEKRHIDHVIPFNFIFATDVYNCVAACPPCNRNKSNHLPKEGLFCNVIVRNDKFMKNIKTFESPQMKNSLLEYDKEWYLQTYENCIKNYHRKSIFFMPRKFKI